MSIKRKLTLMMMGISLAAVLSTVAAVTTYLIYDMRKSKMAELEVTAAITGDRNGAALAFLDNARARRNLEIFRMNPSIMSACIYDAKGAFFAAYEAERAAGGVICPPTAQDVQHNISGKFVSYQEIRQAGEVIGNVYLLSDTREINAYVRKILQISGTVALLVLAAISLLTIYLQRTISGPILELAAMAKSITENRDFTLEAKAVYQDETGVLARAFNNMLAEVRNRDRELTQMNETLEQKVKSRTEQLESAKRKAEAASEAKSEFLRNMSHEFRTPLHAIISFSSYGIKEFESTARDQLGQYFELIQKGAERLGRLVNEVLDLAKLEQGDHTFLLKRCDMRELALRSADMVRPLLADKNVALEFDHSGGSSELVCDHDKIAQVITNLLGNAIKFTPSGRTITLRTGTINGNGTEQVTVSVIDEGVGIPESEKETIFESFRQSSRTNTGAGGTGLGLAICRSIVKAHGGHIWAENNADGPGACVTFSIPAVMEEGKRLVHMQTMEASHENAA